MVLEISMRSPSSEGSRAWRRAMQLFAFSKAAVLATGCGPTVGQVALNQDPNIRWVHSPVGQIDPTLLASQQGPASAAVVPSWEAEAKCTEAGFANRTNAVIEAHNAFTKRDWRRPSTTSKWLTDGIKNEGMVVSLIATQIDLGGGAKGYSPVPWNVAASFESQQTGLVIARVAHKAILTDDAAHCVTSGMCRNHNKGEKVKYIRGVYYGNLIRLELRNKKFKLEGTAMTPQAVNTSFALKTSDMTMSGSITGLVNTKQGEFDVPFILENLRDTRLINVQEKLASAAEEFGVIAIELGEGLCE